MSINKVIYDGNTLIDLTDDTVDSSTLLSGYTAHNRSGDSITGTFDTGVFVLKAGDTMTGALTLSGAPTSNLHAATKKYVDDAKNIWYGTSTTAASTRNKIVTTTTGNFVLATGNMVRVKFTNNQTYNGGAQLTVDGTTTTNIMRVGETAAQRYIWLAGEVVDFVYDGTNFVAVNEGIATTTYYGTTKLNTSATSTSETTASTPRSLCYLVQNMIANYPVYSASATYAVGDRVRYSYNIYQCNTAISTAESWNADHWTMISPLIELIEGKQDKLTAGSNIQINGTTISATDTTYESKTAASGGTAVSLVTTGEKYTWNNKSNFSGSYTDLTNKPTLGTAAAKNVPSSGNASTTEVVMGNDSRLTDSRNAADVYSWAKASTKPTYIASEVGAVSTTVVGSANGVASLDNEGKVPSSQLPSYVDDVLEYSSLSAFPATGESGKIYIALDTNKTYRWSGTTYVEISESLALGETSSTAYRGDRGKTAYNHATDSSRLTTATASGLYKVASTVQGHIASLTAVEKSDITALGIPSENTTYSDATQSTHGLMSTTDKTKLDGIASGAEVNVQSDWNQTTNTADDYIKNKPTLGTAAAKNIPTTGDASTTEVVLGNDSRLSDSRTPTSHTHGNIQNGGTLQTTDITIASGDKLVVTDSSNSNKIARTSVSFDGSTATKCLTQKGTWESFSNNAGTVTSVKVGTTSYTPSSGVVSLPAYPTTLPASDTVSTYSATGTAPVNGTAVAAALETLDGTISGTPSASKTLTAFSETDGKVSATFGNISITKSQISDFPTITDENVKQTGLDGTEQVPYRVLLSSAGNDTTTTAGANKAAGLRYTPYYGWFVVDKVHSGTSSSSAGITIGNSTEDGTAGSTYGIIRLYGKGEYSAQIAALTNTLTADRTLQMPDQSGTIAITSDITSAINALDGSITGSAGSGKTLTAFSQTNGVVSATFGNISITKSQVSDFPTLATVATSGSYNDLSNKPTITDENVKQTATTSGYNYPILFSQTNITAGDEAATITAQSRINGGFLFNPGLTSLYIRRIHTATTTASGQIVVGNSTASGTAGASHGIIYIYGKGAYYGRFIDSVSDNEEGTNLTANRGYYLPDASGFLTIVGTITGSAGAGKTLTSFSATKGKLDLTFGNISITKSQISDFPTLATVATSGSYNDLSNKPTIPTITDTYSGTSSDGMSGKAVKSAIDALDASITGSAGSGKTLTAFSQTNGIVTATFGDISITKSQVSDFPTLATVATSGSYNDLSNKPTIPTVTDTYSSTSSNAMSGKAVKSAIDALDGSITGSTAASKTLTAFSQTDGIVTATFGDISITKSQISDFPTITDENVKQTKTTSATNANYAVLFGNSSITANSDPSTVTEGARISGGLYFNPSLGALYVRRIHTSTTSQYARVLLGNAVADGTANSSYGEILLYGKGTSYCTISTASAELTANRTLTVPDVTGVITTLAHVYSINGRIGSLPLKDSNDNNVTNLNHSVYTKPGKYYCNATVAATLTNSPITDTAFIMTVENTTGNGMGAMTDAASSYRRRVIYGAYSSGLMYVQICYTNSSNVESYGAWARYTNDTRAVLLTGGTMTGALTLSGAPTSNLHAATKKYVDDAVSGLSGTVTSVALSGSSGISISGSPITTSGTITVSVSTASGSGTRNTTNVSSGTLTYRRYGKVVVITGSCYPASSLSASKTLFSGLPNAKEETIIIASSGDLSDAKAASLCVDTSGVLKTKQSSISTSILYISGAYISE